MNHLLRTLLAASLLTIGLTACQKPEPTPTPPTPKPDPEVPVTPEADFFATHHIDVWTWMPTPTSGSRNRNYIVRGIKDVSAKAPTVGVAGQGADLTEKLHPETIYKGKYYYQISKEKRFGKYIIKGDEIQTVKEFPYTYIRDRFYDFAWLDDRTLLLVGANGSASKVLWAKIDVEDMKEIAQGELSLPTPPAGQVYSTSGIIGYRKSDKTLIYVYKHNKAKKEGTDPKKEIYAAFVDATSMTVKKHVTDDRAEMMAGTAYGELRQSKAFFDENDNYYIACNTSFLDETDANGKVMTTAQHASLLRVNKGATDFDRSYNGYKEPRGKIITIDYLDNGTAIMLMQDPKYAVPHNPVWDSKAEPHVFYFVIIDLTTGKLTYLDKQIPFSTGNLSQLAIKVGDQVIIGNNSASGSAIYTYDIKSGKATLGVKIASGLEIERLVPIED